ncbi:MAG: hypothetical protein R2691_06700 [Solirubrobacterales bacterium]
MRWGRSPRDTGPGDPSAIRHDSGVCHQAFFADPDGNALAIHHRYAPSD